MSPSLVTNRSRQGDDASTGAGAGANGQVTGGSDTDHAPPAPAADGPADGGAPPAPAARRRQWGSERPRPPLAIMEQPGEPHPDLDGWLRHRHDHRAVVGLPRLGGLLAVHRQRAPGQRVRPPDDRLRRGDDVPHLFGVHVPAGTPGCALPVPHARSGAACRDRRLHGRLAARASRSWCRPTARTRRWCAPPCCRWPSRSTQPPGRSSCSTTRRTPPTRPQRRAWPAAVPCPTRSTPCWRGRTSGSARHWNATRRPWCTAARARTTRSAPWRSTSSGRGEWLREQANAYPRTSNADDFLADEVFGSLAGDLEVTAPRSSRPWTKGRSFPPSG